MIKFFKYLLEAIIVYLFFFLGKILGLFLSRKFFSFVFKIFGPIFKSKKIINGNLELLSKNISSNQKKQIISNMWSNYGKTFIEYVYLKNFRNNSSHINIKGEEILNSILISKEPVIFVSGHFANFELMSMELTKKKINLATIYRPLNNFFLNFFMEYLRKKYICKNQIKKGLEGVKKSIDFIKSGYSIALMIDQRVSEGEKVEFFKKDAFTTTLPAQLALKYKLKIVPIFIERNNENNFEMEIFKPLDISNLNKIEITIKLNQILEGMIEKNPYQWIWTHNRWK